MINKINAFCEKSGLSRIPMMYRFFGKLLPVYLAGAVAAASTRLLSSVFAGQLYAVITLAGSDLQQFAAEFFRVLRMLVVIVAVTGVGTIVYLWTTAKADRRLRMTLTRHIMRMPVKEWTKRHSSDWLSVTGRDADDASAIYKEQSQNLLGALISVVGGLIITINTSLSMAVFSIIIGLLYMKIGISRSKVRRKHEKLLRSASVELTQQISDYINGSRAARFYPIRELLQEKQEEKRKAVYRCSGKIAQIRSVDGGFYSLGYTLSYSGALIFGLLLVNMGRLDLSTMLGLWPLAMGVSFGILDFGFLLADFQGFCCGG